MDCASCRKAIKKDVVKYIPCNKAFHPGCIGLHKTIDPTGRLAPCKGASMRIPSDISDEFVDASCGLAATTSAATTSTATTTTTTTTTTVTITAPSSDVMQVTASARPSYRTTVSAALPPAPTTDLSQLCANVRLIMHSQNDIKSLLQVHTGKLNQCTEFIQSQKEHNVVVGNSLTSLAQDINTKFESLTRSYHEATAKITALETSLAALKSRVDALPPSAESVLSLPGTSSAVVDGTIQAFSARLRDLEQDRISCDLLISGLPELPGEDLVPSVIKLSELLEVPMTVRDIVFVRRLPGRHPRSNSQPVDSGIRPRALLLRLSTSAVKSALLSAKRRVGRISASQVSSALPDKLLHINDFIPKESWLLLKKVRAAARERGYRFSWYSRGSVLVKKDVESTPLRIGTEGDIAAKML